jgi:hypothetical protein
MDIERDNRGNRQTALLEWIGMRWRRPAPVPQSGTAIFSLERTAVRVPPEYRALYIYLEHRYASVVVLTLEQIEALLGSPLPTAARTERTWWTGGGVDLQPHAAAWTGAGRTATPNLSARTVTFERLP